MPLQGLYPESHGIIDNNMYDHEIGKRFYLGSETSADPRWWGGEPVSSIAVVVVVNVVVQIVDVVSRFFVNVWPFLSSS